MLDARHDLRFIVGFGHQRSVLAQIAGFFRRVGHSGIEDDMDIGPMLADPTGKAKAVEFARHLNIGKDNVNCPARFDDCLCIVAGRGFNDMEAAIPVIVGDIDPDEQLVLDDEDRFAIIALCEAIGVRLG
nr:hypothetical protein [Aliihoeflea sp. 40Bstr573]